MVTATSSFDTEEQLVQRAQQAISACRWTVGECASAWTQRYSRGRTDADFAQMIGLSTDQVYQRRRVSEVFSSVRDQFPALKWSHFYSAINWDDALECLRWAEEAAATVAEMKAWRRAQRGEDLTSPSDELLADGLIQMVSTEPVSVGLPDDRPRSLRGNMGAEDQAPPWEESGEGGANRLAGVARQFDGPDAAYSPFREGAMQIPQQPATESPAAPSPVSCDVVVKRMTSTLERCTKVLTPEFLREFQSLPEALRSKFFKAVSDLHTRTATMR